MDCLCIGFTFARIEGFMIRFSNAKINVGLYVTGKRADGYHNIESLFFPIGLQDAIELIPANENSLAIFGNAIPGNQAENSCMQALNLMQELYSVNTYKISIQKQIPIGGGLGGGSSNSAAVIHLINELEELNLSNLELQNIALQIGSDDAFFIENKAKFVSGRGEKMSESILELSGFKVVLINPNLHQSTKEAYEQVLVAPAAIDLQQVELAHLLNQSIQITNAFQFPFVTQFPETQEIINQLKQFDAIYASLSGSGSTFYGLFAPNQTISPRLELFAQTNGYFYDETKIL